MSSYNYETLLWEPVKEVVRCMPREQREEVRHQTNMLYKGAQRLEYTVYPKPTTYRRERVLPNFMRSVLPKIVNKLALNDLEVADSAGFPVLSPGRAMKLSRMAMSFAGELSERTSHDESDFQKAASGMVGLHGALLGSEDLLEYETAKLNLQMAENKFAVDFVVPLSLRRRPSNMPNINYQH